jgi:hypothetical protein
MSRAEKLANLLDEVAAEATSFHDVADSLRRRVGERDDEVHRLVQAFEFFLKSDDGRTQFEPMLGFEDGSTYPAALREVAAETVELWNEVEPHVIEPAGRARLSDLLFERRVGNGRDRAERAIDAYLALSERWPPVESIHLLPRALELARRVGTDDDVKRVHDRAVELADASLDVEAPKPGVPLRLLAMLVEDGSSDSRIDECLARAREVLTYVHDATRVIELQRLRATEAAVREALDRELVAEHLSAGEGAEGFVRAHHLEAAAAHARDRGLVDLHEQAMAARQAMSVDDFDFSTFSTEVQLSRVEIDAYIEEYLRAEGWREALHRFAQLMPPTGHVEQNREAVRENAAEFPLQSLFSRVLMGADGLPRFQPGTDAERFEVQLAEQEQLRLQFWSHFAVETMERLIERFGRPAADELEAWLAEAAQTSEATAASLRRALEYLWDGEHEAALAIALPRVETLCRALVLLFDRRIYELQRRERPGQYPGLRKLLPILAEHGLPESWVRYFSTTFASVAGWNLRNEHAHGFVDSVDARTAVVAVHAALFLATLPIDARPDTEGPEPTGPGLSDGRT